METKEQITQENANQRLQTSVTKNDPWFSTNRFEAMKAQLLESLVIKFGPDYTRENVISFILSEIVALNVRMDKVEDFIEEEREKRR